MGKVLVALGIVVGGTGVFLGSTLAILSFQGKLEGESLKALSRNPIMGAFVPAPEPLPVKKEMQKADDAKVAESKEAKAIPFFQEASRDVSSKELMEMLESVSQAGVTILLVEQNFRAAIKLAHRFYIMGKGRIVFEGDREALQAAEGLRKQYLEV